MNGKKVLHVDRNGYYGADTASLSLHNLFSKFRGNQEPGSNLGHSRGRYITHSLVLYQHVLILALPPSSPRLECGPSPEVHHGVWQAGQDPAALQGDEVSGVQVHRRQLCVQGQQGAEGAR